MEDREVYASKLYYVFAWIITFVIFLFSLYIQQRVFIDATSCWHLIAAERLYDGGTYLNNFFQPNPPSTLYINFPIILLAKLFDSNPLSFFHSYVYVIATISLLVCFYLLRQIIYENDLFVGGLMLVGLALVFFILPSNNFGTQENFVIILTMPYYFLSTLRCRSKTPSNTVSLLVGILAGIGFCLKVSLILAFLFVEIYLIINKKTKYRFLRPESLLIIVIYASYIASLFIIHTHYIHIIFPMAYDYYHSLAMSSAYDLIVNGAVLMWFCIILLMIALRKIIHYPDLSSILFLASLGLIISFFISGNARFISQTPSLSVIILLALLQVTSLTIYLIAHSKRPSFANTCASTYVILLFVMIIIFIPTFTAYQLGQHIQNKSSPYSIQNSLLDFISNYNYRGPLYFFSTQTDPSAIIISYSELKSGSRFPSMWLLSTYKSTNNDRIKKILINSVVNDFNQNRPNLVFIDKSDRFNHDAKPFDYIGFFSQDTRFQALWQNYHFINTIHGYDIYLRNTNKRTY